MAKAKTNKQEDASNEVNAPQLTWHRASYHFHTFAYRDPRSAFASGTGLPVISPTTVLLGITSTLFSIGKSEEAKQFMTVIHQCEVLVDAPNAIVFFRAFHQLRRYETLKYGANPKFGLTKINQGTREYGLVDGQMTLYVGVPENYSEDVSLALTNLNHIGTHDSLCSLTAHVENCNKPMPEEVLYLPSNEAPQELRQHVLKFLKAGITIVTLSRFKKDKAVQPTLKHWHMSGGQDTELLPYAIPGSFQGTTRGKIYRKHQQTDE